MLEVATETRAHCARMNEFTFGVFREDAERVCDVQEVESEAPLERHQAGSVTMNRLPPSGRSV